MYLSIERVYENICEHVLLNHAIDWKKAKNYIMHTSI